MCGSKFVLSFLLIYLTVFINVSNFGQSVKEYKLDSLKAELKKSNSISEEVKIKLELGELEEIFRKGYWDTLATEAQEAELAYVVARSYTNRIYSPSVWRGGYSFVLLQ